MRLGPLKFHSDLDCRSGRINRRQYLYCLITVTFVLAVALTLKDDYDESVLYLIMGPIFCGYIFLTFLAKRLRDIGISGKYSIVLVATWFGSMFLGEFLEYLYYLAFICFALMWGLLFAPGEYGDNKFGPSPENSKIRALWISWKPSADQYSKDI